MSAATIGAGRDTMPKLYVLSGPDIGKSFEIGPGAVLGRGADCAAHLRDASVSRTHARLDAVDGRWRLVDLGSRNGLGHAGTRVKELELDDGAEFQVGEVLLRFRSDVGERPSPAGDHVETSAARTGLPVESTTPASRGAEPDIETELGEEIVLEGEWSAPAADASRPRARPDVAATTIAPRSEHTTSRANVPLAPAAPVTSVEPPATTAPPRAPTDRRAIEAPGTSAVPAPAAARPATDAFAARGAGAANRGILQYKREPDRQGFFSAELSQQPLWVRAAVALFALAVFATLFWLAFRGTLYFKGRQQPVGPGPAEIDAPMGDDRR